MRIHGEEIRVKARIRSIDAYSGHADRDELVDWARPMLARIGTLLLVHGEPRSMAGLTDALVLAGLARDRIAAPTLDERFDIVHRDGRWMALGAEAAVPRLGASEVAARRDWHNDYAETLLDLRAALQEAPDDEARRRLLQEMHRLIAAAA